MVSSWKSILRLKTVLCIPPLKAKRILVIPNHEDEIQIKKNPIGTIVTENKNSGKKSESSIKDIVGRPEKLDVKDLWNNTKKEITSKDDFQSNNSNNNKKFKFKYDDKILLNSKYAHKHDIKRKKRSLSLEFNSIKFSCMNPKFDTEIVNIEKKDDYKINNNRKLNKKKNIRQL